jgi:hypothetical protein
LPLLFVLACVGAFAQANSDVTGIVTDQTGAVVAGAKIVISDPATGAMHSTVSSGTGLYDIPGLNAANYNMKVTAKGFETFLQNDIVVNISNTFRVDIKLTIGAETQTITVEADALAVQSDSNVVSTLINEQQITDLPTNGRNIIGLAALGLGVSGNLPDAENPFSVNANYAISFNGLSQAHNIWIVDGGEAYDRGSGGKMSVMPSQDALGEFQVLASNYPPDYGIASGGAITMSIKSGTQKFHGEAWEFDRNDALDAHNYFDPAHSKKQELRYNVFGANAGGPVFIPHMYNAGHKKTFFFVNEEWRKMVNGVSTNPISTMPGTDEQTTAADFDFTIPSGFNSATSMTVPTVGDTAFNTKLVAAGLTPGSAFPDGSTPGTFRIPGTVLDSNALAFNATKNLPAATDLTKDTYTPTGGHLPINVREDLFRIDHTINDKWSLLGHFIHDANDSVQATPEWQGDNFPTVGSNFSNPSYSSVIKLTGSLTPDVLLEASFNYDGNKIAIIPVSTVAAGFVKPSGWSTGTYFPAVNDVGNRLPDITWQSITKAGGGSSEWGPGNDPWTNGAEDYAEVFGLSVTKGKHQMKFGGGYNRYTKNQVIGKDSEGDYTFDETQSGGSNLTGDSYLDFLLGLATNFSEANANPINHYVNQTTSVYAQDNWHASSRLSVQFGFRYDAMPHVWERNNQVSNFDPTLYQQALVPTWAIDPSTGKYTGAFAATSPGLASNSIGTFYMNGIAIAGQNGVPRGLAKQDYKSLMPRVGFSYDLRGNGKTVVRGGFGTFYERIQGNDIYDAAGGPPFISQPSANNVEFTGTSTNWESGGTASTPTFPQGYNSLNTYYPNPAVAQFSLGVQHEIAPALILITQYVGNLAWHQNTWVPINNYPQSTPMYTRLQSAGDLYDPNFCTLTMVGTTENTSCTSISTVDALNAVTYPGFGKIRLQENPLTGTYNSFQIGLRQQNKHGLSFEVDYTYAHQIDDTQGSVDVDNNNPSYNPWNLKYDKGSGALDRRQVLNANYEYKMPFFAHADGLTKSILGGWEISGTFVSEAGLPWVGSEAPGSGGPDTVGLGGDYRVRPNLTGKPHYTKGITTVGTGSKAVTGYQYVSSANFSQPMAAWDGGPNLGFGNAGKDAVVGPGRTNFTTALYKSFAFGERAHFEVRIDSFNTFNHTQFNGINNGLNFTLQKDANKNPLDPRVASNYSTANNFGFVTGTQDPREFEIGGKFVF